MSENTKCTGFPVGNFGIAGEVSPDGRIFPKVMYNPPVLGEWLETLGQGAITFSSDGVRIPSEECEKKDVFRLFPEASAAYTDPKFGGLVINVKFFAPIKARNTLNSSIPALCVEFELINTSGKDKDTITAFDFRMPVELDDTSLVNSGGFWLVGNSKVKIGYSGPVSWRGIDGGISISARRNVPAKSSIVLRFMLICHDLEGHYAPQLPGFSELAEYVSSNWEQFKADRAEFISLLPKTHDKKIDEYMRWYLQAGVLLTRVTRDRALTMGYCELNQRDSFWASWLHLVMWPELEKQMIEESAEFQRGDGKIPTTILSTIERGDDIDINEYFNLRVARYYERTHDLELVRDMWPALKASIEYLLSTDKDNDGYLDQGSYWCDWKDVQGVEGRKAAPHFEFLWLAALKSAKEFAGMLGDKEAEETYTALYNRSYAVINEHTTNGGLWTGEFYASRWYDGREDNSVQEDQFVGPLFGVVPEERIGSIYAALEPNMADWGVRDTYPYRKPFSHEPGVYHNGGIWPFLNFADALSRFVTGYPDGAYQILRRVGEWDLEKEGDYLPHEFLNGETGANSGWWLQGWNADYYAAVYFGLYGVKMLSETGVQIMPRIADTQSFETPIMLPSGILRIKQTPGKNGVEVEIRSQMSKRIKVKYGAMTARTMESSKTERVGECEFRVVEFTLGPGAIYNITLV